MPVRRQDDGLWLPMRDVVPVLAHSLGERGEMIKKILKALLLSSGYREIRLGELVCFTFVQDELRIATALSSTDEALACTNKLVLDSLRERIGDKRDADAARRAQLYAKRQRTNGRRREREFRFRQRAMA